VPPIQIAGMLKRLVVYMDRDAVTIEREVAAAHAAERDDAAVAEGNVN
jgi:hypothetical protein